MKLTRIEITNDRLLFANNNDRVFSLDLLDGINALIGLNNCGKPNVLNAVAPALDPAFPFDPRRDWPRASSGPGPG
jgi:predicted ATP-dependent endonuclease of OLD family